MNLLKGICTCTLIILALGSQAQKSANQGMYLKLSLGNTRGFERHSLPFNDPDSKFSITPGGGFELGIGTGISAKSFDFEVMLVESMIMAFNSSTTYSNNGSSHNSSGLFFFKTNISTMAFYKKPLKKEQNSVRFGAGPLVILPGKLNIQAQNEKIGTAAYDNTFGAQVAVDWMIQLKKMNLNPGILFRSAQIHSSSSTFTENQEKIKDFNLSGLKLYLGFVL